MSHYRSDREHLQFLLFDVLEAHKTYMLPPFSDFDRETAVDLLTEGERFAVDTLADSFAAGDRHEPRLDPDTHAVHIPVQVRDAVQAHLASDWLALDLPAELSGVHVPPTLRWALTEFVMGANPAVGMATQLVPQVVALLRRHGTPTQRRLAELIIGQRWTVTMVLTEDDAGSDVGAARTRAVPQPDGTWWIEGTKRFITWGEHDAADNIVHLVLARPVGVADAGGPGTKGLSLFVVPSHHHTDDGQVLDRNGVVATALETKMGVTATPTCELVFGGDRPAVGTLLGDRHDGIRQMFEIISYVRMLVGLKAGSTLSSGYHHAAEYAATRRQGTRLESLTESSSNTVAIIDHPDIRRSLLTQRCYADGARALVLYVASLLDRVEAAQAAGAPDHSAVDRHRLLLPVVKGWCSENAWRVLGSESLQVLGGSGYLKDYPLEQYVRDTKIDTIYEGTTGIQALDLLGRRIVRDRGAEMRLLLDDIRMTADELLGASESEVAGRLLSDATDAVAVMVDWSVRIAGERPRQAALGANRLLFAIGDLTVGWLLLRATRAAKAMVASGADPERLAGTIAAGRWYARQVLPRITAEMRSARLLDEEALALPASAL